MLKKKAQTWGVSRGISANPMGSSKVSLKRGGPGGGPAIGGGLGPPGGGLAIGGGPRRAPGGLALGGGPPRAPANMALPSRPVSSRKSEMGGASQQSKSNIAQTNESKGGFFGLMKSRSEPQEKEKRNRYAPTSDLSGYLEDSYSESNETPLQSQNYGASYNSPPMISDSGSMKELIKSQKANGSFLFESLASFLSVSVENLKKIPNLPVSPATDEIVAIFITAIVVEIFQKKFEDQKVNWNLIVKKSKSWIAKESAKQLQLDNFDWSAAVAVFLSQFLLK